MPDFFFFFLRMVTYLLCFDLSPLILEGGKITS